MAVMAEEPGTDQFSNFDLFLGVCWNISFLENLLIFITLLIILPSNRRDSFVKSRTIFHCSYRIFAMISTHLEYYSLRINYT